MVTTTVYEPSTQSLDGDSDSPKIFYTTQVQTSPTYESCQKSVRFSMPIACMKKLFSNDIQVRGTHGIFNTVNTKQFDDSNKLLPATSHCLPMSSTKNKYPHINNISTLDSVLHEPHPKEIIEKQKIIKDFVALLDKKIVKPICKTKFGKPSLNHSFISEATFEHGVTHLLKSDFLDEKSHMDLSDTHPLLKHL